MNFVPAGLGSLLFFVVILGVVVGTFLLGISRASQRLGIDASKNVLRTSLGVFFWLCFLVVLVESGQLEAHPMPGLPIFFALVNFGAFAIAFSSMGKTLALGLPFSALIAFQSFRLPLELVLHLWAKQGTIPETMTWTGSNYDIVTGILAVLFAPLSERYRLAAWVFNGIGLVLLLNVMRVALLSSPISFGWNVTPPLQLAYHFPYCLIAPICVGGALAGHLILARALFLRTRFKGLL